MGLVRFFENLFGVTARREREENMQRSRERAEQTRRILQEEARAKFASAETVVPLSMSKSTVKPITSRIKNPIKPKAPRPPDNVEFDDMSSPISVIHRAASDLAPDFSEPVRHYHAPVDHSPSHHSSWHDSGSSHSSHDSGSSSSDSGGGGGDGGGGDGGGGGGGD